MAVARGEKDKPAIAHTFRELAASDLTGTGGRPVLMGHDVRTRRTASVGRYLPRPDPTRGVTVRQGASSDRIPVLPDAPDRADCGCPRPELLVSGEDQPAPVAVNTVAGGRLADHVQEDDRDGARVLPSIRQRPKAGDKFVRNAERRERFECRHGRQRALVESRYEFGR